MLLSVLIIVYFGSLSYTHIFGRKEKTDDVSDEDEIQSTNDFNEEPTETDNEANNDQESTISISDLTVSQQLSSSTPLRSDKNTPQHVHPLASQLRLHDTPEKSGGSGSSTSFLQRAHEGAKLASTRNKAALTMTDTQVLNDNLRNQHEVGGYVYTSFLLVLLYK